MELAFFLSCCPYVAAALFCGASAGRGDGFEQTPDLDGGDRPSIKGSV